MKLIEDDKQTLSNNKYFMDLEGIWHTIIPMKMKRKVSNKDCTVKLPTADIKSNYLVSMSDKIINYRFSKERQLVDQ